MRNHRGVAVAGGEIDGVEGFADSADLVDFDQNRVGYTLVDSFLQKLNVGDENIVAYQLNFSAQFFGQVLPAIPVFFGEAVFERDDGIIVGPFQPEPDHLVGTVGGLVGLFENVFAVLIELAGGGIERYGDFFSGLVARLLNGFQHDFD